jgi:uncharacterized protein involved in response to NO
MMWMLDIEVPWWVGMIVVVAGVYLIDRLERWWHAHIIVEPKDEP